MKIDSPKIENLITNGFVKTSGSDGTLSVDTTAYQPLLTPAALTKVDDTNVTIILGGTPATSLLQAVSITLGWTGTLADARIASAATWNAKQVAYTNLTTIGSLANANGFLRQNGSGVFSYDTNTYYLASNPNSYTSNLGTVTSVSMTVPTGLTISGSPITTSGTLALTLTTGYSIPTTASQSNWDAAYSARITTLTVIGSSGSATLVGQTLNIPTYTLAGLGGQPLNTNLTSLSALSYTSASFVKMTAAGTFALDTNTYLTANQTITLSGDVSGSGTTAITTTLASIITAGGPTGSSSVVPVITYDAKGRLTAVSTATITPASIGASPLAGSSSITTVGTLSSGSIPYSLLSGTIPTWNQNTTGTAANVTFNNVTGGSSYPVLLNSTNSVGYNATVFVNLVNGSLNATTFIGAGNSLTSLPTNTALYPTLNQNTSGTAAIATTFGGSTANFGTAVTPVNIVAQQSGGSLGVVAVAGLQSFLGLGSNAYTSTAYLPLTGGTLTGGLTGTSASFSSSGNTFTIQNNGGGDNLILNKGTGSSIILNKTNTTAQSWAIAADPNFRISDATASTNPFTITLGTGAATFSSSVTAKTFSTSSVINPPSSGVTTGVSIGFDANHEWGWIQSTRNSASEIRNLFIQPLGGNTSFGATQTITFTSAGAATFSSSVQATSMSIGIAPQTDKLFIYNESGTNTGETIQQDGTGDIFRANGNSGANRFTITQAGVVSILATTASTSTTTGALVVSGGVGVGGNVYATGFYNSSDAILKNVLSRDGDVVYFNWKDKRDNLLHIGYIAQEMLSVYPNQVSGVEGSYSVNYTEILVDKVRRLENKVLELEKLLNI
ncbi:MAG: hypothetical protein WCP46_00040 [Alphaproteobacteria bacterium]